LGDPKDLEIVVELLSEEAVSVCAGQRVLIKGWGGKQALNGVVRRVEPFGFTKVSALGIEEQRVKVLIDLEDAYESWRALGHGYRVEPSIIVWEAANVLRVPTSAIFREGDRWAVFVDGDGTAQLRVVDLGHQTDAAAEVLRGLGRASESSCIRTIESEREPESWREKWMSRSVRPPRE
jgi:HlyD family secretion protein